ncbi:MAG: hypothetical protein AAF478_04180 [Pseudomonadota bacterium]
MGRYSFVFMALLGSLYADIASASWKLTPDSWQVAAIARITNVFGKESFDHLIWAEEDVFWGIRPGLGTRQNLLANNVCRTVRDAGKPDDRMISVLFFDTEAFLKGEFREHASIKCR